MTRTPREWIETDGGQLVIVPSSRVAEWCGAEDGSSDYALACSPIAYFSVVPWAGEIAVGGRAVRTVVQADERGVVPARWMYSPREAIWEAKLDGLPRPRARAVTLWSVTERGPTLFDAASPGPEAERRVVHPLEVGLYLVTICVVKDNEVGMVVHTIERAR